MTPYLQVVQVHEAQPIEGCRPQLLREEGEGDHAALELDPGGHACAGGAAQGRLLGDALCACQGPGYANIAVS
jgi:hypothetical protein